MTEPAHLCGADLVIDEGHSVIIVSVGQPSALESAREALLARAYEAAAAYGCVYLVVELASVGYELLVHGRVNVVETNNVRMKS